MGCGKSTVSACFSRVYGMRQCEMDEIVEKEEGSSISEIFAEKGESYFRQLETNLLKRFRNETNLIVSCGGGTAMREHNVLEMKTNGKIILLLASPETIYERVHDSHNRPLLEGNMNISYIRELLEVRMPKYQAAADYTVATDGKTAEEICKEILRIIG